MGGDDPTLLDVHVGLAHCLRSDPCQVQGHALQSTTDVSLGADMAVYVKCCRKRYQVVATSGSSAGGGR